MEGLGCMAAQLLGKSKGAKHPLPTYFPPNRGEKIACSMGSSFSFSLCQSWGLLSPPGLENQGKSSTRLGLAFSSHFFFFFLSLILQSAQQQWGGRAVHFQRRNHLNLLTRPRRSPRGKFFLSPAGHPGRAQQAAEKHHGWAACCSAAFLSLKASQTGAQSLH